MADAPTISYSGQGTRQHAADLGQTIGQAMEQAVAGRKEPLHIDTLQVQVPAGASTRDIERAIERAIARQARGGGP